MYEKSLEAKKAHISVRPDMVIEVLLLRKFL